jgi:hypothetical protein
VTTRIQVGDELSIISGDEGEIGRVVVNAISPMMVVRAELHLQTTRVDSSKGIATLRRLSNAADELSLVVMEAKEVILQTAGFALKDIATEETLVLGRDFRGVYVSPGMEGIAFSIVRDTDIDRP